MSLRFDVEHRHAYSVVRVEGEPSLGQFLSFLQLMAVETSGWTSRRALFDLRGVDTLASSTEQCAVAEETARRLSHLHRVASLLAPNRVPYASEQTAQLPGPKLAVFTDEAEALAWLTSEVS